MFHKPPPSVSVIAWERTPFCCLCCRGRLLEKKGGVRIFLHSFFKWLSLNPARAVDQLSERWILFRIVDRATKLPEKARTSSLRIDFEREKILEGLEAAKSIRERATGSSMGPFELQYSNLLLRGYKQHLPGLPWPLRAAFVGQPYLNPPALSCCLRVSCFPTALGGISPKHQWSARLRLWLHRLCEPTLSKLGDLHVCWFLRVSRQT